MKEYVVLDELPKRPRLGRLKSSNRLVLVLPENWEHDDFTMCLLERLMALTEEVKEGGDASDATTFTA